MHVQLCKDCERYWCNSCDHACKSQPEAASSFAGETDEVLHSSSGPVNVAMYYLKWAWRMEKKRTRLNRFAVSGKAAAIGNRDTYFDGIEAGADDIDLKHALMERNIAAASFIVKLRNLDIIVDDKTSNALLKHLLVQDDFDMISPIIANSFRMVPDIYEGEPTELRVDSLLQKLCYAYVTEFSVEPRLGSKVVFDNSIHGRICFSCFACAALEPIAKSQAFVHCNMCQMLRCRECNKNLTVHGCVSSNGGGVYGETWKLHDFRRFSVLTKNHTQPFVECFASAALYWSFDRWMSKHRYHHGGGIQKALSHLWKTRDTLDFIPAAFEHYSRIRPEMAKVCDKAFIERFALRVVFQTVSTLDGFLNGSLQKLVEMRQLGFSRRLAEWVHKDCGNFDYVDFFRESYYMAVRRFMWLTQGFAGSAKAARLYGDRVTQESYAQAVRNFQKAEQDRQAQMVEDTLAAKDKERFASVLEEEEEGPNMAPEEDGMIDANVLNESHWETDPSIEKLPQLYQFTGVCIRSLWRQND